MTRAPKICPTHGCPKLSPCPIHTPDHNWDSSKRKTKTFAGRRLQRRNSFVMSRDGWICHVCQKPGADQVDHIKPLSQGGTDDLANLAPIHSKPCHKEKTQREAQAARTGTND